MAQRVTICVSCGGRNLETINEINPDTYEANMDVILKCKDCFHEAQYQVTSHHFKNLRRRGFVR